MDRYASLFDTLTDTELRTLTDTLDKGYENLRQNNYYRSTWDMATEIFNVATEASYVLYDRN